MRADRCGHPSPGQVRPPSRGQEEAAADGQLIRMLTPELVDTTRTSSARPEITASPNPAGIAIPPSSPPSQAAGDAPAPLAAGDGPAPLAAGSPARVPSCVPAGAPDGPGAESRTTTTNRSPWSVISILTGPAGKCRRCASTAREQASPTARRTSSSSASSTPLRRATAVATSRAVRTCAGSGVNVTSTVAIGRPFGFRAALLLGLLGRDGLVYRLVDAENLRQPGDPEDLEYALLRADQIQGSVVGTHSLQPADQHSETGGVQELDLLHVDDELVIVLVDEIDKQLTEPRRRVDVDFALDVDDLDAVLVVVTQLQIQKSSNAMQAV